MEMVKLTPKQTKSQAINASIERSVSQTRMQINELNLRLAEVENDGLRVKLNQQNFEVSVQVPDFVIQNVQEVVDKPEFIVVPSTQEIVKPVYDVHDSVTSVYKPVFKVIEKEEIINKPVYVVDVKEMESLKQSLSIGKWIIIGLILTELVQVATLFLR